MSLKVVHVSLEDFSKKEIGYGLVTTYLDRVLPPLTVIRTLPPLQMTIVLVHSMTGQVTYVT